MRRGHVVAGLGALALLLVMAMDWYGTVLGDEARRQERIAESMSSGAEAGEPGRRVQEDARHLAEREEKNAWQADAFVDRVLLALMLGAIALALINWFIAARGAPRRGAGAGPPEAAAVLAAAAALLVAYRIIQEPGLDQATTIKLGAPLALVPLAMIALGIWWASREEEKTDGQEAANAGAA